MLAKAEANLAAAAAKGKQLAQIGMSDVLEWVSGCTSL
jgi:hypothetical protein